MPPKKENSGITSLSDSNVAVNSVAVNSGFSLSYSLFQEKQKQIEVLEFECNLLMDKYFASLSNSNIPLFLEEDFIRSLFDKDKSISKTAREHFLTLCFSAEFTKNYNVEFLALRWHGCHKTAVGIALRIGEYIYMLEIPLPKNVFFIEDKKRLMGQMKFRADRLPITRWHDAVVEWEALQMPTYAWAECLKAIEADVEKENRDKFRQPPVPQERKKSGTTSTSTIVQQ